MTKSCLALSLCAAGSLALSGCEEPREAAAPHRYGRYVGIGVYSAGEKWREVGGGERAARNGTATAADDEHVIVVIDSVSGQVRQCGDYSGRCIALDPWKPLAAGFTAPVLMTDRAASEPIEDVSLNAAVPAK